MEERDYRDAMAGDAAAASRVILEATRREKWAVVAEVRPRTALLGRDGGKR